MMLIILSPSYFVFWNYLNTHWFLIKVFRGISYWEDPKGIPYIAQSEHSIMCNSMYLLNIRPALYRCMLDLLTRELLSS